MKVFGLYCFDESLVEIIHIDDYPGLDLVSLSKLHDRVISRCRLMYGEPDIDIQFAESMKCDVLINGRWHDYRCNCGSRFQVSFAFRSGTRKNPVICPDCQREHKPREEPGIAPSGRFIMHD
jgi:hypothetical protein